AARRRAAAARQPILQRLEPLEQIAERLERFGVAEVDHGHLEDETRALRLARLVDRPRPTVEEDAEQPGRATRDQRARLGELVGGGVDQIGRVGDAPDDLEIAQEPEERAPELTE